MRSLRARLLSSTALVLLVFVVLTALSISWAVHQRAEQAERDRLQGLVWGLLGATDVDVDGTLVVNELQLPEPALMSPSTGLLAELRSSDDRLLWQSRSSVFGLGPTVPLALGEWAFIAEETLFSAEFAVAWRLADGTDLPFRVRVASERTALRGQLQRFDRNLFGSLLAVAAALLLLQLLALRFSLKPLQRIGEELGEIERGERALLDESLPSELAPLASGINTLLESERTRQQQYRNLLDDLAHRLKTPLAVISNLDVDSDSAVARQQGEQMQATVRHYLQRASSTAPRALSAATPVLPVLQRLAASLPRLFPERTPSIAIDVDEQFKPRMAEQDLFEVLGNVLENACKYGATHILVRRMGKAHERRLLIEDDGPGFPPALLSQLTERGLRADQLDVEGQGLGLAAARELMAAYGGQMILSNRVGGGASVELDFP